MTRGVGVAIPTSSSKSSAALWTRRMSSSLSGLYLAESAVPGLMVIVLRASLRCRNRDFLPPVLLNIEHPSQSIVRNTGSSPATNRIDGLEQKSYRQHKHQLLQNVSL